MQEKPLEGKIAIVTGAASPRGLGRSMTEALVRAGARVSMMDINQQWLDETSNYMREIGGDDCVMTQIVDVSSIGDVERSIERTIEELGGLHILVNNAGIAGDDGYIWELPVEELDRVYHTILRGVFIFSRQVLPHMMERDYGRIVNIASISGKEGNARMVPYSSCKAAVIALTKAVGKEVANTGIRVNCVTPAVIQTRILEQLSPEVVKFLTDKIPLGRAGQIEEVAALVAWLASEECSFSTGAVFDISGGRATY